MLMFYRFDKKIHMHCSVQVVGPFALTVTLLGHGSLDSRPI
jgi:hypothetical protein